MLGQSHLHRDILAGLIANGTHGLLMVKVTKWKGVGERELEMEGVREENRAKGRKREQMGGKENKSKKKKRKKRKLSLVASQEEQ